MNATTSSPARALARCRAIVLALAVVVACNAPISSPQSALASATLSSSNVVPAVASPMSGTGSFAQQLLTLAYTITLTGETTNPTAAHLHIGAAGTTGPVLAILFNNAAGIAPVNGMLVSANVAQSGMTPPIGMDSLRTLIAAGLIYVDVHSKQFPDGEIRGQLK